MRVTVASRKGGTGKTSSAVFLAEAAARTGRTLLVDADPQGSALGWSTAAEDGLTATVIGLPTKALGRELRRLEGWQHVVIDTPPGEESHAVVRAAMSAADVVLIPVAPTGLELDRLPGTLAMAEEVGVPAVVLLVRVRPTASVAAVAEALEELEVPTLATRVPLREAIASSFGDRPRDLFGYHDVWKELAEWLARR